MRAIGGLVLATVLLVGCSSTVATPEGSTVEYRWVRGDLRGTLPVELPRVDDAARLAFEELSLVGVTGGVDGLEGELTALTAVGTKVRVKLKALDFETTLVRIRVGQTGNKAVSLQLYRHIERQLIEQAVVDEQLAVGSKP